LINLVKKYQRTYEVEAIQFDLNTMKELREFTGRDIEIDFTDEFNPKIVIEDEDGNGWTVEIGDYVIKGVNGEFNTMKKKYFEHMFKGVE
jgi:hypothetical protein